MRRAKITNFTSLGNRITSEAGGISQSLFRNTGDFVNDISKGISRIEWVRMYKKGQKSLRLSIRKGNKAYLRSLKVFRKSDTFRLFSRDVPRYFNRFVRWTSISLRKLRNLTVGNYRLARKFILRKYPKVRVWVGGNYPVVRNFVRDNYPRFENFILNRVPLYKMVYFGNR